MGFVCAANVMCHAAILIILWGNTMPEIDLKTFEKSINLRQLRLEDFEQVTTLQLKCFSGMPPWNKEQYTSQVTLFPEGQIGVEYQGQLIASSSSLILDFDLYSQWHSWLEIADNGY
ncbi:MAG: hypothetical protein KKA10_18440, partial [Euryarchaeota archaeon]|nr:hypothetical protein [Euryarchaeota archaeon]